MSSQARGGNRGGSRSRDRLRHPRRRCSDLPRLRALLRDGARVARLPSRESPAGRRSTPVRGGLGARIRARDPRLHGHRGDRPARAVRCVSGCALCGGGGDHPATGRRPTDDDRRASAGAALRVATGDCLRGRRGLHRCGLVLGSAAAGRPERELLPGLSALDLHRGRREAPLADRGPECRGRTASVPLLRVRTHGGGQPSDRSRASPRFPSPVHPSARRSSGAPAGRGGQKLRAERLRGADRRLPGFLHRRAAARYPRDLPGPVALSRALVHLPVSKPELSLWPGDVRAAHHAARRAPVHPGETCSDLGLGAAGDLHGRRLRREDHDPAADPGRARALRRFEVDRGAPGADRSLDRGRSGAARVRRGLRAPVQGPLQRPGSVRVRGLRRHARRIVDGGRPSDPPAGHPGRGDDRVGRRDSLWPRRPPARSADRRDLGHPATRTTSGRRPSLAAVVCWAPDCSGHWLWTSPASTASCTSSSTGSWPGTSSRAKGYVGRGSPDRAWPAGRFE